jgi:hypothetical protein
MSIGIVIKGPEGLVLAAESRITLEAQTPGGPIIPVSFDNARKVLQFAEPNSFVGVVTYGLGSIGLRSAYSFIPEFKSTLPTGQRLTIQDFSQRLSDFFMQQWNAMMPANYQGPPMTFVIGGFNDGEPYGRMYLVVIPRSPTPVEQNPNPEFGITWGGQREIVDRLIRGYDERAINAATSTLGLNPQQVQQLRQSLAPLQMQIPIQFLPLQDCIDLSIFFVRTTIEAQRLTVGIRGCGGSIDIATITRQGGFEWVQEKRIHGEAETTQ